MRVLRLTPFFHHPDALSWPSAYDSLGGMQIQTWRQAVWLAEAGISQHVLTIGFPGLPRLRQLHPNLTVQRSCLPMHSIRSELSGLVGLTYSWAAATLAKLPRLRAEGRIDVIHAHFDGQIPAIFMAWAAPKIMARPLVITVHCSRLAVYQPRSRLDRWQHGFARWLERRALAGSSAALVLTRRTASVVADAAPRVMVLPDIVDTDRFHRPETGEIDAFRTRYGLRRRTVGYVGRIAKEKGWRHLITLAKTLREDGVGLLVVGDGPQRAQFDAAVAAHCLEDWVTVTGFIANSDVPAAMASCEVLVMPSDYEEFGGASIEAFATGTPVVAFAVGGLAEIVGGADARLLVEPGDVDSLIARTRAVLAGEIGEGNAEDGGGAERGDVVKREHSHRLMRGARNPEHHLVEANKGGNDEEGWEATH